MVVVGHGNGSKALTKKIDTILVGRRHAQDESIA